MTTAGRKPLRPPQPRMGERDMDLYRKPDGFDDEVEDKTLRWATREESMPYTRMNFVDVDYDRIDIRSGEDECAGSIDCVEDGPVVVAAAAVVDDDVEIGVDNRPNFQDYVAECSAVERYFEDSYDNKSFVLDAVGGDVGAVDDRCIDNASPRRFRARRLRWHWR